LGKTEGTSKKYENRPLADALHDLPFENVYFD
jgi:hypothetical protein